VVIKKYTISGCIFEKINAHEFVCYREYNSLKDKEEYLKKGELTKVFGEKYKDYRGYRREILYTIKRKDL
jgi:hypothetical protein